MKMPLGKYKNWEVEDVPTAWLNWFHGKEKFEDLANEVQRVLDERAAQQDANNRPKTSVVQYDCQGDLMTPMEMLERIADLEGERDEWKRAAESWQGRYHQIKAETQRLGEEVKHLRQTL